MIPPGRPVQENEEIEITAGMVKAGLRALETGRDAFDEYCLVSEVYSAMERSRRRASS